jgi:hypothetical protein
MKNFLEFYCPVGMFLFTGLSALQLIALLTNSPERTDLALFMLSHLNPLSLWVPAIILFVLSMIGQTKYDFSLPIKE